MSALSGLVVHDRVPRAGVDRERHLEVLVVTVLPLASSTVTIGWVAKGVATRAVARRVVKTSLVAPPVVMVKLALVAVVSARGWL